MFDHVMAKLSFDHIMAMLRFGLDSITSFGRKEKAPVAIVPTSSALALDGRDIAMICMGIAVVFMAIAVISLTSKAR